MAALGSVGGSGKGVCNSAKTLSGRSAWSEVEADE